MPITPQFTIHQTDSHVVIDVAVPHIRVTNVEVVVVEQTSSVERTTTSGGSVVHVAAPPIYLLVLNFAPYRLRAHDDDDDDCTRQDEERAATVEPVQGIVRLELEKLQHGQHWDNLDLIGRLVMQSSSDNDRAARTTSRWLREVVVDSTTQDGLEQDEPQQQHQVVQDKETGMNGYGFARLYKGVFTDLVRDGLAQEMLEGHNSVELDLPERRRERLKTESDKFCVDRYLGDLEVEDDYLYQCAMAMQPHWTLPPQQQQQDQQQSFSQQERLQLQSIPYPLLPESLSSTIHDKLLVLGLIDLLFGYVYDHLLTDGDPTVESAWTVSTLSASLSWMDDWLDERDDPAVTVVRSVVHSSLRRALVYPYLRNFDFAVHCMRQVGQILQRGLRTVIRCLLQLRGILDKSELHYLGNKLFVDPYLAWLQQNPSLVEFDNLAVAVEQCLAVGSGVLKNALDLDLIRIEASLLSEEEQEEREESSVDTDAQSDDESSKSSGSVSGTTSQDDDDDDDDASSSLASSAVDGSPTLRTAENKSATEDALSRDLLDLKLESKGSDPLDLFRLRPTEETAKDDEDKAKKILIQEM